MNRHQCIKTAMAVILLWCTFLSQKSFATVPKGQRPNIVIILADDMGYGELQCLNPTRGKIKTPQLDAIAAGGMIFTDAHSGSSVCTPTRYGLMTGRYAWRTRLQNGVLTGGESLIAKDRLTMARLLKQKGYHTAMFGKWHLGMLFNGKKESKEVALGATVTDGPIDAGGFDEFHGFHHARQIKIWIDNDRVTEHIEPIDMLPRLCAGAVDYINGRKGKKEPFFLYVPWSSPHSPVVPSPQWQGKSRLNAHADFVMQTDDSYGQVIEALRTNEMLDTTLVICSSDNGTSAPTSNKGDLEAMGHFSSGDLRGSKADIWDGGHRVPFIAHWPKVIKPGSHCNQLVCLSDVMATAAELVGFTLPPNAAEDSMSFLSVLMGRDKHMRTSVIHHSISGYFAMRQDNYKLIMCPGSGGWTTPKPTRGLWQTQEKDGEPMVQLYNMTKDLGERTNLAARLPEKVKHLQDLLQTQVNQGRTTPGPKQTNDAPITINKKPGRKKRSKRPNILFILADDQSPFDLKMYNPDSTLDTPVLDKLASEGMVFDGAYHMGAWSGAVCTPSRHMIMSGRTVWHIPGKHPNAGHRDLVPADLAGNTMAAVFNRAGYATMRTCKKGNSYAAANGKFTVRHDSSKRGGTDETGSAWHAQQVLTYLDDRQAKRDTKPFMIYYGFSHPHDPRNGKVDLLAKYGAQNHTDKNTLPPANPKQPVLPVNYLPAHPFHHGHPGLRDEVNVSGVWKRRDERTIRNELGREFACSENIDIQIGRVLKKLKEMGELDNTYIFYTADHGMAIGRHGLQGKQNLYEHTWRVPFIVKGPRIRAGSRVQGNIYLLDTLGTLCDLAGINAPNTVESKSFKPVLEGKKKVVRDTLFGVYCGGTKPGMRSVRRGDWKLIKYDVINGTVRQTQLFNLKDNPHEFLREHQATQVIELSGATPQSNQVNLAHDPRYADKLAEMEALLLSEMRRLNDPYRLWDQPDDGLTLPTAKTRKKKRL
jgi:choline-sulfatase